MAEPTSADPASIRPVYGDIAPTIIEQDKNARMWGMFAHLSSLVIFISIPSFLGPLVVWLLKKDQYPFVDDQGKEALNLHLCATVLTAIIIPLTICFFAGVVLLAVIGIYVLVVTIIAAMKANEGIYYRYPVNFRLIK